MVLRAMQFIYSKTASLLTHPVLLKKSLTTFIFVPLTFCFSVYLATSYLSAATLPMTFGYQGFLTNTSGVAQTGTSTMIVRIYDAPSGGTLLFEENEGLLPVVNGYFSVRIGNVGDVNATTTASATSDLAFDQPYYITIELGVPFNTGEMKLSGGIRSALNAVPYSVTSYGAVTSSTSTGLISAKGKLYYDTIQNQLFVNNGSTWQALGIAGAGITTLNGLTGLSQLFIISNTGNDVSLTSSGNTHTFAIPDAGSSSRGVISTTTQTIAGNKTLTGVTSLATTTISTANIADLTSASGTITNFNSNSATFGVLSASSTILTNSTSSTGFFSSLLTAFNTVVTTLTGGTITGGVIIATSSLASNGTLDVTGQTTLANASTTGGLTVSGQSVLATTTATTLMLGTTTPFSLAKVLIDNTISATGSGYAIAGIHGNFTVNSTGGDVEVGNRFVLNNAPTVTANTAIGEIIRTIDNTSLANTVRGIDVTSNAGSNTTGINTGIRTTGATFGIQALTTGLAGGVSAPAAIYGQNTGTTNGDVLRLYSSSMTSAATMANIYQEISTFTGNALTMNMGLGGGSFTGNFVDFRNNDVTKFVVDSNGNVGIGTASLATTTLTVAGDVRLGTSGTNGCLQGFGGATLTGTCTSDQRLKDNVIDISNVLDKLSSLRIVNFNWNDTAFNVYGNDTTATQTGYIAQNIESLFPELVHINKEGYREVNYSALGLYAVEGVKELAQRNASTTASINDIVTNYTTLASTTNSLDIVSASTTITVANLITSLTSLTSQANNLGIEASSTGLALARLYSVFDISSAPTISPSLTIDTKGELGLGTNHPLVMLHIENDTATGTIARFQNADGYCDIDPTTNALVCTTDDASRTNILPLDTTSTDATTTPITATTASTSLEKLTSLNVVTYALPGEASSSSVPATRYPLHAGLLFSDIQSLFPDLVKVDLAGKSSFSLTNFIPYIIESIKSLSHNISNLATDIASIKHNLITDEVKTKTICLGDTCIDEAKLKGMIEQQTTSQVSSQVSSPTGEQSIIQVLGVSTSTNQASISTTETASTTTDISTSTASTPTTETASTTTEVAVSSSTPPTEIITSPSIILDPPVATATEEVLPPSSTGTITP